MYLSYVAYLFDKQLRKIFFPFETSFSVVLRYRWEYSNWIWIDSSIHWDLSIKQSHTLSYREIARMIHDASNLLIYIPRWSILSEVLSVVWSGSVAEHGPVERWIGWMSWFSFEPERVTAKNKNHRCNGTLGNDRSTLIFHCVHIGRETFIPLFIEYAYQWCRIGKVTPTILIHHVSRQGLIDQDTIFIGNNVAKIVIDITRQ